MTDPIEHRCQRMKEELALFFLGGDDEDTPIVRITKDGEHWHAWNRVLGMAIKFCPFCGVELNTIPLAAAWCTSCNSPCHCAPRNGHDCVHPPACTCNWTPHLMDCPAARRTEGS